MAVSVKDCTIITLPKIVDARGNLTFLEGNERHIPFEIKRVFYVYDVPTDTARGAHAHKALHQFVICLSGGLDVTLDDGRAKRTVRLNRPWIGLHIPPMIWAAEKGFDPGTVYLVLASDYYDPTDYIRDHKEFLHAVAQDQV
jgi:dTDP-4-dehydrorhamnose 3,5-epimerase-like enzyme